MSGERREMFRVSKEVARELGVGKTALRLFLRGTYSTSPSLTSREAIRRSLKYAQETVSHVEHNSIIPSLLMING